MLIMRSLRRQRIFLQKTPATENARSLSTDVEAIDINSSSSSSRVGFNVPPNTL